MKIELNVPEVVSLFKEIQCQSEKIFSPSHSETACLSAYRLKAYGKRNCAVSNLKRKFCH